MNPRQQLRAISQKAPGFTGLFLDDDGIVTLAVATDDFPAASQGTVMAWARKYFVGLDLGAAIRLRRVPYDYVQLSNAFAVVQESMQPSDGLTLLAIDEAKGVIRLGLASLAASGGLRSRLAAAGVPPDMLAFEHADVGVADATLQSNGVRPAVGIHSNHSSTRAYFSTMDQIDFALNSAYYHQ
jgi:hypothetical protein